MNKRKIKTGDIKIKTSAFLFKHMVSKASIPAILTGHPLYDPDLRERIESTMSN